MIVLADAADREAAVRERDRNVLVEASAGTGKTTLVVERLVALLAPRDGQLPMAIDRIAAITFTRKAAGDLGVRIRQRILTELANIGSDHDRVRSLRDALAGLDTAYVGTIHAFANRLLRKWPAQAGLDPRYELGEDDHHLVEACFELLLHSAETGTLRELLADSSLVGLADEATTTILDAQVAGLRMHSRDAENWTYHGLDGLIAGFIQHRDIELPSPPAIAFDRAAFEQFVDEYLRLTAGLSSESLGGRWLVETADSLRTLIAEPNPAVIYREIVERLERGPKGRANELPRKGHDFADDQHGWDVWKAFDGDERRIPVRVGPLREDLLAPLRRWLAIRLSRLRPVVLHLYEVVKARRQAVDHVDLLLRLRDLLRDDRVVRRACQSLFDHIFVDESQDTDPLQAEIVLFLCEDGVEAADWQSVQVARGKLTLVGDPKQSIYRFRRADITTYRRVLEIVGRSPCLAVRLSASFRSAPGLVGWLNERFAELLGAADGIATGEVAHQPLTIGRELGSDPTVHVVALSLEPRASAADVRALEAVTLARYLRWLVHHGDSRIVDPWTSERRPIGFGDIGVLGITTTQLPTLFAAFDRDGVPYAARGGTLFVDDPVHRQFLLGLAALADRDDGVAVAALLRPPFFAVDLGDLARSDPEDPDDRALRARAVVRELRRRRFERSPGATARALFEETGFGRTIAVGPNGLQRLSRLRELCFQVEARAAAEHLDFDAVVARLRSWIDRPPRLDAPHPVDGDAVRVLTVHQAKGLEFPVVAFWDCRATWKERSSQSAYTAERDGRGWAMRLDQLQWEEPSGLELSLRETRMREAERKRLVYVAATRARDILILPKVVGADERWITARLVNTTTSPTVIERDVHASATPAVWFASAAPPLVRIPDEVTTRDSALHQTWVERAAIASQPRRRPSAFTDATSSRAWWGRRGRYGTAFGETVHVAIGHVLRRSLSVEDAVGRAAIETRLRVHLDDAAKDVRRAIGTLTQLGLTTAKALVRLEYPISGLSPDSDLLAGYIDFVTTTDTDTVLLDFKTDTPPSLEEPIAASYLTQVLGYADVLASALELSRPIRAGLLFTADGGVRWLRPEDAG